MRCVNTVFSRTARGEKGCAWNNRDKVFCSFYWHKSTKTWRRSAVSNLCIHDGQSDFLPFLCTALNIECEWIITWARIMPMSQLRARESVECPLTLPSYNLLRIFLLLLYLAHFSAPFLPLSFSPSIPTSLFLTLFSSSFVLDLVFTYVLIM